MERVTGIGGFFFRATDPDRLGHWYAEKLGVDLPPVSYDVPSWQQEAGPTVFSAMASDSRHFGEAGHAWAINFRVANLARMVAQLRDAGVPVDVDTEAYPNGRFAGLQDPEGNRIQLWEPAGADLQGSA